MLRVSSPVASDLYDALGQRISKVRELAMLRQQDLADATGLSRPGIANIEAGRQTVALHHLVAIAQRLGVPAGWLIGEANDTVPLILATTGLARQAAETCEQMSGALLALSDQLRVNAVVLDEMGR